jgi:hypothetical protein
MPSHGADRCLSASSAGRSVEADPAGTKMPGISDNTKDRDAPFMFFIVSFLASSLMKQMAQAMPICPGNS